MKNVRRHFNSALLAAIIATGALILAGARPGVAAIYNVLDLGTLGGDYSQAAAVNASGQIVGFAYIMNDGELLAAFWSNSNSSAVSLGDLGGDFSLANDINLSGQIVGKAADTNFNEFAAFWTNSSSAAINLGAIGGTSSSAEGINRSGKIVGYADVVSNLAQHAVLWTNTSTPPIDLGTLGGDTSAADSINDSNQMVGYAYDMDDNQFAAFWPNSSTPAINLGALGGTYSVAAGINNSGQIVGSANTLGDTTTRAVIWTNTSSPPIDLGALAGSNSQALAINNFGQIVGSANSPSIGHAVLWTNISSQIIDLNSLIATNTGWTLESASAINDSGEIVGYATTTGGVVHAVALVPILPPSVAIKVTNTNVVLTFPTIYSQQTNIFYNVQRTTNLVSAVWSTIASNITGTGSIATNTDSGAASAPNKFYRVVVHF